MIKSIYPLTLSLCTLILLLGCKTEQQSPANPKASLTPKIDSHIMISDQSDLPIKGTYQLSTKMLKIKRHVKLDVAAIDKRITRAIHTTMQNIGFSKASQAQSADILIGYAAAIDENITAQEINSAYADSFAIQLPMPEGEHDLNYHRGMLVLDIIDNRSHQSQTKKLIWRGAISGELDLDVSEKEKDARVQRGVNYLLNNYPKPQS